MNTRLFTFIGGNSGPWTITRMATVTGDSLPPEEKLDIVNLLLDGTPEGVVWLLRGVTSNERYVTREE